MPESKPQKSQAKKFLSGYIDFGVLGKKEICIFKNDGRENEKQPSFRVFVKEDEAWKEVGALWTKEVKEKEADEL